MSIHDFSKYKRSKTVLKDIEKIDLIFDQIIKKLEPFKHYQQALDVLLSVKDNKSILKIHLDNQNRIKESKGKIPEEE